MGYVGKTPLRRLLFLSAVGGGSPAIERIALGNPATFGTDLARPLVSLEIPFTPKQEGTGDPSPQNIRNIIPWNGLTVKHGGKNLLNVTPYGGVFFNVETGTDLAKTTGRATYTQNGNEITVTTESAWYGCVFATDVLPSGTYNVHTETINTNCKLSSYITDDDLIVKERKAITSNNITITLVEPSRIAVVISNQSTGSVVATNVQVESGSAFIAYEPYKPITETDISFASPVYGGTLDAVAGVLTVEWVMASFKRTVFGAVQEGALDYRQYTDSTLPVAKTDDSSWYNARREQKSNICVIANPYSETSFGNLIGVVFSIDAFQKKPTFRISDALYQSLTDTDDIEFVYELATPQEIQLTPQQITALVGNNTIWSDTDGSMTCVYLVSSKYAEEHPVGGFGFGFGSGSSDPDEPDDPENPDDSEEPNVDDSENNQIEGEEP